MKLLVGLGNPGKKYHNTRHNLGFMVLDELAESWNFSFVNASKFRAESAEIKDETHQKIFCLKPQTYMNLSGQSVGPFLNFYKLEPKDMLVIYDDLDLSVGKIRFVKKGGAGGHNGIKSIIECTGTNDFHRLKIGIGRPEYIEKCVTDHVLEKFDKEDIPVIAQTLKTCEEAIKVYLAHGITKAMNDYNGL